jgi:hypothetical protein
MNDAILPKLGFVNHPAQQLIVIQNDFKLTTSLTPVLT